MRSSSSHKPKSTPLGISQTSFFFLIKGNLLTNPFQLRSLLFNGTSMTHFALESKSRLSERFLNGLQFALISFIPSLLPFSLQLCKRLIQLTYFPVSLLQLTIQMLKLLTRILSLPFLRLWTHTFKGTHTLERLAALNNLLPIKLHNRLGDRTGFPTFILVESKNRPCRLSSHEYALSITHLLRLYVRLRYDFDRILSKRVFPRFAFEEGSNPFAL